jgi:uncharacterized protein YfaS (alpha-2-macroglobulin family)
MSYPKGEAMSNRNGGVIRYQKSLVNGHSRLGVVLLLFFSIVTGSLPQLRAENRMIDDYGSNSNGDAEQGEGAQAKEPKGLQFRLSQGQEQPEARVKSQVTPSSPLSEGELASVLRRLPGMKIEPDDQQDFALRGKSLPRPRTGQTIGVAFPATGSLAKPTVTAVGPLQVLRVSPEGAVPLAPQLSVTFSQPMVAVTSNDDLAATEVPVHLTPQPAGRWRWMGTRTLVFEPEHRFPAATRYNVMVPAGTRSANGGVLAGVKTWSFETSAPRLVAKYPTGNSEPRDPVIFLAFDQKVDAKNLQQKLRVSAAGRRLSYRPATADEIKSSRTVSEMIKSSQDGYWIALKVVDASAREELLPSAQTIGVTLEAGAPSAEGPLTTPAAQSFSFKTYGPLRITGQQCGYEKRCTPADSFIVEFSNSLDTAFQASQVKVEPEIPGMKTAVYGNGLHIDGFKRGRTTYKVRVDGSIKDQFGQTLGSEAQLVFNVGSAPPMLGAGGGNLMVLDPAGKPRLSVFSINQPAVKVRLYKVAPEDWETFCTYMQGAGGYDATAQRKQPLPPGRLVFDKNVEVTAEPDVLTETRIDLSPALDQGVGQVVALVQPTVMSRESRREQTIYKWIQATRIGLNALVDQSTLVGWATSLTTGKPLAEVELSIYNSNSKGRTGDDGIARLQLPDEKISGPGVLIAREGDDTAILPQFPNPWSTATTWRRQEVKDSLAWFVFDDRGMYKPGEEVHLKGWVRRIGGGPSGDVGMPEGGLTEVGYNVRDPRNNNIKTGTLKLNPFGAFDFNFQLPDGMNLGYSNVDLFSIGGTNPGEHYNHAFQVQEFRRPEFEVTAQTLEGPLFIGDHADTTVTAAYYAGGGLSDAEVNWQVTSTPTNYTPPNRSDFTFGTWVPWWIFRNENYGETRRESFKGQTDASGKHRLRIDFDRVNPPRPSSVVAQASVMDVNRQTWTATTTMLVHPASLYVGLRSDRTFVKQGEPLIVESIVTDLDGKAIANREVRMKAFLLEWVLENGAWVQKETNAQECAVQSANDAVKCTFTPKAGGMYRVSAEVRDDRERRNQSELTLWVAGGKQPPKRDISEESVDLIPDKKEYRAGDTAQILVQSPFYPADGVMTIGRSGIIKTEHFRMDGPSTTLSVPIQAAYLPNVRVEVNLAGSAERPDDKGVVDPKLPRRPAFAKGEINLPIPPLERKLAVQATPKDKAMEPGKETTVAVDVKDASGRPVGNSETAVVVVDESILALSNYKLGDPLDSFYVQRGSGVSNFSSRGLLLLAAIPDLLHPEAPSPPAPMQTAEFGRGAGTSLDVVGALAPSRARMRGAQMVEAESITATKDGAAAADATAIALRQNFNALAVFSPSVVTDANGHAEVKLKLPDSLTRYRVMAVTVSGGKLFGSAESSITARMPLMVRPSAPRFLNFGDKFELPVVVQNQTDSPMEVEVGVRASNAELTSGGGRKVTVPANDRVEVRFPVSAVKAGKARFDIGVVSGKYSDAAQVELPVWTPATTEAFATYGEIDQGAIVQPFKAPSNTFPQFGGLEITTSSTQLQELTDAVLYLMAYPYECSEQISSRVLAVAALKDVLTAFKAKDLPTPDEMKAAVARDIKRLQGLQNDDGGFGFWRRGEQSWPYLSIHVAHALEMAKAKGFDVPAEMLDKSRSYLKDIEKHIPSRYSVESRRALIAYALYVRSRMNDRDAGRARRLIAEAGLPNLSLEAVGWLLTVLSGDKESAIQVDAIRKVLNNRATETAGTAHFTTSYTDGAEVMLHSERRVDGIILDALIQDQPQSDLIPKIVRGLLAHRSRGGCWSNTQENAFILLALDRYFNTYEKTTPDFVAQAWLGERFAGEQAFHGRSTDQYRLNVPMKWVAENSGLQDLTIAKEGAGRLYYRIGMQYAPANLKLAPADYGFAVERVYEAVDDPGDVRRDGDGKWHIKAGARVRVRLTMTTQTRRYHVALVDPMPAGLEALNPELAVTGSLPEDKKDENLNRGWWWMQRWFEHQNMRDERVEAFTSLLWEGVYNYSYVARATTPGAFVVPPVKAEEMYSPENYGRGGTDLVVVE